jgi:hypothetical protein
VPYGEMAESRIKMVKSTIKRGEKRKKEGKGVANMCTKADPSIF